MARAGTVLFGLLVTLAGWSPAAAGPPPLPEPLALEFAVYALEDERAAIEANLPVNTPGPDERTELIAADSAGFVLLTDIRSAGIAIPASAERLLDFLPGPESAEPFPTPPDYDAAIADVIDVIIERGGVAPAPFPAFDDGLALPVATGPAGTAPASTTPPSTVPETTTPASTSPASTAPATSVAVAAAPVAGPTPAPATDSTTSAVAFVAIAVGAIGLALGILALWRGRRHDRLATIATTDGLTGLRNRRSLDHDLDRHGQFGDEPTAFLMIDVDHFKAFNDTHGHAAGDGVLRAVASTIERTVRSGDVTYRYGGEEFCVLLPRTDDATASLVAERIRRAIETSHLPGEARVTISVGVAAGRAEDVASLIGRADGALYAAKDGGRNRIALG